VDPLRVDSPGEEFGAEKPGWFSRHVLGRRALLGLGFI